VGKIEIRPMAARDVATVARLRKQWTEENAGHAIDDPGYDERFVRWVAGNDRPTWVAEQDGEIVGMVNLAVFDRMPRPGVESSRWGYLANAYVVPPMRNAGVGKLLIDALMTYARDEGLVRVVLSPSERSVRFYERAGFGPADMLMAQRLGPRQLGDSR
jgi:GNAT superfamily N-acetyltransferase